MSTSYYLGDRGLRGLRMLTPPSVEPITLTRAKQHLRIEDLYTRDDDYISALITAARQYAETVTRRALCNQQWTLTLDRFPATGDSDDSPLLWWWRRGIVDLVKPPLISVDSLRYDDVNGTPQTLVSGTDFRVDIQDAYARIEPIYGQFWPFTRFEIASVHIDHTSGYTAQAGDPSNRIPATIKQAILLLIGSFYENREDVSTMQTHSLPMGADALLSQYRVMRFS